MGLPDSAFLICLHLPKSHITHLSNPCLHVAEMTSRGFGQLEEYSQFATVMFLDRDHFHFLTGGVVHNHASAASLLCMLCTNSMPDICKKAVLK